MLMLNTMEGIIDQRVTPLLKCMVLFLFIFTAKVLTSRPHESQDTKNSIHPLKPSYYVRTFTKYHHRRTIQWNNLDNPYYWPVTQDSPKVIKKRSINSNSVNSHIFPQASLFLLKRSISRKKRSLEELHSNEFVSNSDHASNSNNGLDTPKDNKVNSKEKTHKTEISSNGVPEYVKRYKVKPMQIYTDAPTTMGPTITCVYKIKNVLMSATPSYEDDKNAQMVVESDSFETGTVSTMVLNGEVVQVEKCTDTRATCYTLWQQDVTDNITILGQGCWVGSSSKAPESCLSGRVTSLPATGFCSCAPSLCNARVVFSKELPVTMRAHSTMSPSSATSNYINIVAAATLAILVIMLKAVFLVYKFYCKKIEKEFAEEEKGEVMGSGPDSLATGLSCVDNLTLVEPIGQGKFGCVWRGTLGTRPVAVKLFTTAAACQKEASIYTVPNLAHPNLLKYFGSDTRSSLTDSTNDHFIVLELCSSTLRARLEAAPVTWMEFANLAHGLASALAHLHKHCGTKPCIAHRDVNSNNILVSFDGCARLADLGTAQILHNHTQHNSHLTEWSAAGTARYLPPEALEGALDVHSARTALTAQDVYAAGLVMWEMLWRCSGAHAGPVPPYCQPYQHACRNVTIQQLQNLVSRNKVRPPLPKGPVQEYRALRIASETCEECWDHDAEARLTAVCVEERMSELKQMLQAQGPVIHDNNLHPHLPGKTNPPYYLTAEWYSDPNPPPAQPETDKNCNSTSGQSCDITTPLLYPHIGRNTCIERNTHTNTQTHTVQLIHKSLKDISVNVESPPVQNIEEHILSVARPSHNRIINEFENSDRLNEIRSYQRPLDYVPNDVSNHDTDRGPKRTNILHDVKVEKPKWGIKKFFEKTFNKNNSKLETEVKLVPETSNGFPQNGRTKTSIINEKPINYRPPNLVLSRNDYNFEVPCTLSPPNKTLSPNMIIESEMNRSENRVFGFKELPSNNEHDKNGQIFAVIVPKAKPTDYIEMRNKNSIDSSDSINKSVRTSMSSQSIFKSGNSDNSEDSTVKKRLSCDNRIISNSGRSSRASINLELQYIDNKTDNYTENDSPFDLNSDCSSSEDEHLMLLSEGSKITMQTIPKAIEDKRKQNEVLKEASVPVKNDFGFNKFQNKYSNFDNEYSDPNDKENLVNTYSGDNPVYLAALNGEIDTSDIKFMSPSPSETQEKPKSPKPSLKNLTIKRQHSLEQVSEIFSSSGDMSLQNPAGRVKTPGDLPVAVRRARRDRALQKGRSVDSNRLSLYDDRMMFGNSL